MTGHPPAFLPCRTAEMTCLHCIHARRMTCYEHGKSRKVRSTPVLLAKIRSRYIGTRTARRGRRKHKTTGPQHAAPARLEGLPPAALALRDVLEHLKQNTTANM